MGEPIYDINAMKKVLLLIAILTVLWIVKSFVFSKGLFTYQLLSEVGEDNVRIQVSAKEAFKYEIVKTDGEILLAGHSYERNLSDPEVVISIRQSNNGALISTSDGISTQVNSVDWTGFAMTGTNDTGLLVPIVGSKDNLLCLRIKGNLND